MKVTLIDYGMGNLWSVQTAIEKLGHSCLVTSDASDVCVADILILPGVGSFNLAMAKLTSLKLDTSIQLALNQGAKILGICLGMQLMCRSSTEDGYTKGLGLIDLPVEKIRRSDMETDKTTHVGFNTVSFPSASSLANHLGEKADFYFVHSYCAHEDSLNKETEISLSYTFLNGRRIIAAFERSNIYGVQFHPEKSQSNGLQLISNFLRSA